MKLSTSLEPWNDGNEGQKAPAAKAERAKKKQADEKTETDEKYTLKVYPKGYGREVYRILEVSGRSSLDSLCHMILRSFSFDMEHMYEFSMNGKPYSAFAYQSHPGRPGDLSTKEKIRNLGLCKGQKFLFHYDFGDDWMFIITVQKIDSVNEKVKGGVVKEKGSIEQYPFW